MEVEERGYWGGQDLILITLDRHECFSVFHHLQKDTQRKQRHSLKLSKKRRESSKRKYYILSPRVIIKAIIIIKHTQTTQTHRSRQTDKECVWGRPRLLLVKRQGWGFTLRSENFTSSMWCLHLWNHHSERNISKQFIKYADMPCGVCECVVEGGCM